MKYSKQRDIILNSLRKVKSHPTADEVYSMVREELPRISLGTVYRNLEQLNEHGLIKKVEFAGISARWDACLEPHLHRLCSQCGKLEDFSANGLDKVVSQLDNMVLQNSGNYTLEFYGICGDCAKLEH